MLEWHVLFIMDFCAANRKNEQVKSYVVKESMLNALNSAILFNSFIAFYCFLYTCQLCCE